MTLPNDYRRCAAVSTDEGEVVAPCTKCLRYTQRKTDNPLQPWVAPARTTENGRVSCVNFIGEWE